MENVLGQINLVVAYRTDNAKIPIRISGRILTLPTDFSDLTAQATT